MLGTVLVIVFVILYGGFLVLGGILIIKRENSPDKPKVRPKLTGWRAYVWAAALLISGIAFSIGYVAVEIIGAVAFLNWIAPIPFVLPGLATLLLIATKPRNKQKR